MSDTTKRRGLSEGEKMLLRWQVDAVRAQRGILEAAADELRQAAPNAQQFRAAIGRLRTRLEDALSAEHDRQRQELTEVLAGGIDELLEMMLAEHVEQRR